MVIFGDFYLWNMNFLCFDELIFRVGLFSRYGYIIFKIGLLKLESYLYFLNWFYSFRGVGIRMLVNINLRGSGY